MCRLKLYSLFILFLLPGKVFSSDIFVISDSIKTKLVHLKIRDVNGKVYQIENRISVFVFMDVECPISQFFTKNLQTLSVKFAKEGIIFIAVFPTKYTNENEIKSFNNKYNFTIPSVLDKFQHITKLLNANVTPEVFVLNKKSEIVYSGCIDNSFFALGKLNLNPQKFYLEQTFELLINNKIPLKSHVEAIGCEIQRIP